MQDPWAGKLELGLGPLREPLCFERTSATIILLCGGHPARGWSLDCIATLHLLPVSQFLLSPVFISVVVEDLFWWVSVFSAIVVGAYRAVILVRPWEEVNPRSFCRILEAPSRLTCGAPQGLRIGKPSVLSSVWTWCLFICSLIKESCLSSLIVNKSLV